MAVDPVTAALQLGATVVSGGVQIASELITSTQTRRLDAANQKALQDAHDFKNALLAGDLESVNLRLDGLRAGVLVDLTDAESLQLKAGLPDLSSFALLGLYCRGRSADLAAERAAILIDTASTVTAKT